MSVVAELQKRIDAGHVTAVPNGRCTIYNYSPQCVFSGAWDEYTLAARGLVIRNDGKVCARPWPKFFNVGERPETTLAALPAETPELAKKYDGSLIIAFHDDGWRAVTRGCWDNPQTRYANNWLAVHGCKLDSSKTYLFELVAPWNRIVLTYQRADMVLLGYVDTESGVDSTYAAARAFAIEAVITPVEFESKPIADADMNDERFANEEGFVVRYSNGFRVKLKYKQYLRLHKILTGLSIKGIWELLSNGGECDLSNVPDEFMDWYTSQRDRLLTGFARLDADAKRAFEAIGERPSRKDYAAEYLQTPYSDVLFKMLDGKPYAEQLWKRLKPVQHETFQVAEAS